jgi:hypothetical protein
VNRMKKELVIQGIFECAGAAQAENRPRNGN